MEYSIYQAKYPTIVKKQGKDTEVYHTWWIHNMDSDNDTVVLQRCIPHNAAKRLEDIDFFHVHPLFFDEEHMKTVSLVKYATDYNLLGFQKDSTFTPAREYQDANTRIKS